MNVIKTVFGVGCGAFVGLALGVVAAMALGYWSKWASPNDPSAGSLVIVVIITAPAGTILGAVLGGITISRRPRLFVATFLPIGFLFASWLLISGTLSSMDRPRNFVLEVAGTEGVEFVGVVTVDEKTTRVKGNIPAKFEFDGSRMELAFALTRPNGDNNIAVKVYANGNYLKTGMETQTGVEQHLESFGYSETFGGTSSRCIRMSSEEADQVIKGPDLPNR